MNNSKLNLAVEALISKKKINSAFFDENWADRKERTGYYQKLGKTDCGICKFYKKINYKH